MLIYCITKLQQIQFNKMHLLCSPVTHLSDMDTPEADGLFPVHNGMIKLKFIISSA